MVVKICVELDCDLIMIYVSALPQTYIFQTQPKRKTSKFSISFGWMYIYVRNLICSAYIFTFILSVPGGCGPRAAY